MFFVPDDTLVREEAARLGIRSARNLFGGIVPYRFVTTKIVTHELVGSAAARPVGWSDDFSRRVRDVVLPGFSAFARDDAREAVRRLRPWGCVRAKLPRNAGARGRRRLGSVGSHVCPRWLGRARAPRRGCRHVDRRASGAHL
jgi:hypothetical protein